jgi:hypothetical protein
MGYPRHIVGVKCSRRLAQIPSSPLRCDKGQEPPSLLRVRPERPSAAHQLAETPGETSQKATAAKKKQRPGWRGGNTQAAVRTKRQQTGRRGGTPSTCCLMREVCRSRTRHSPLTFQTVSACYGSVALQL